MKGKTVMQKQVKYWLYSHIFDPGFAEGVGGGGGGFTISLFFRWEIIP